MVISSQPNDWDSIAEFAADGPDGKRIVATKLFIRFINDIVDQLNQANKQEQIDGGRRAIMSAIQVAIQNIEKESSKMQASQAYLITSINTLKADQDAIKKRLSNVEQLSWR